MAMVMMEPGGPADRDGAAAAAQVNMGFIAAIVAVATIGGFMFGYDSGVINGTQKGLESAFDLGKLGIGVNVGAILIGSSIGAFGAGRLADRIGAQDPLAVRLSKRVFHLPREAHPHVDEIAQAILFESEAKFERMQAFLDRKKK